LEDGQCARFKDSLPVQCGNVRLTNLHVLNAILYVAEQGCKWRGLPKWFGRCTPSLGRILVWDRIQCSRQIHTKDDAPIYAFAMHDTTFYLSSGCFAEHQRFGYVDKNGQVVIKPEFFVAEDFSEGLAAVRIDESATSKYAFIDKIGAIAIPPQFDQAYSFSEGLAAAETGFRAEGGKKVAGKWGFIDKTGKFVISPRFERQSTWANGDS
jgi:hypothetical protein